MQACIADAMIGKSKQTAQSGSFQLKSKKETPGKIAQQLQGNPERRKGMCAHFVLAIYYNMATFFLKIEEKRVMRS